MRILRKLYLLLLSFFDFFHLQLQYDIRVFSRDAYPTQNNIIPILIRVKLPLDDLIN